MAYIQLEGMEFYAYHGHFKEEQKVGNHFIVELSIKTDIKKAAESDNLDDALDYQKVYKLIEEEMQQKTFLLESLLMRIVRRLFNEFNQIEHLVLEISKMNPPLGGKVKNVSLVWEGTRESI
ncbi:MAG TPA: dihydroneopterin aldolase [Bacteroidales bacterium]|jgi:dihydroneopterin aldolase|nr:dihydroneopterin aldolase [Bacteroidales bacterium]HOU97793.1 dihydroneopterin aldolase [Bacteroidales bacterium]